NHTYSKAFEAIDMDDYIRNFQNKAPNLLAGQLYIHYYIHDVRLMPSGQAFFPPLLDFSSIRLIGKIMMALDDHGSGGGQYFDPRFKRVLWYIIGQEFSN
ncbi:MAG: hypothetical protein M3Y53_03455, partial [Thermoproteota archaeon]|nr:hypothetical protein [Thermoproteota archaeon]